MDPIHNKETRFHDNWADTTSVGSVHVREAFEGPAALETRFILSQLGPLRGRRILDVGAGLGEASVYFALQGAEVVATDLSPSMADFQQQLAAAHGVRITSLTGPAEDTSISGLFDIIYAANLLHHLVDKNAFLACAHRLLKPGGYFVSWDPLKYNPLINVYRRMADKVRTEDENPLGYADMVKMREQFPASTVNFFWLLTQSIFVKYFVLGRSHPNSVRYWKKIYGETPSTLWWWIPLRWLDQSILLRIPGLQWLAWNAVFIGRKT